ncbi:MAG TPA: ribonuclease HI family protein [Candidatus Saccharimonadales bacterium]|jgi:ribonuclease HI/pterin-4a-carbinolamine dehydratase|nr:ribonuclease HI family protein [Candidatus Saccharimonadales bacterium]
MWLSQKDNLIYNKFNFKTPKEAILFVSHVSDFCETSGVQIKWGSESKKVELWINTSDIELTNKSKITQKIDDIYATFKDGVHNKPLSITDAKIFADGGSRGNPGPSASGFVILDLQDKLIVERGVYLGVTTNNQAEYQALKLALEEALKLNISSVKVYMDSLLVVNQMLGKFKIKNRDLWPIYQSIKAMESSFKDISFTHVPRELNKLADRMVNVALDEHLSENDTEVA